MVPGYVLPIFLGLASSTPFPAARVLLVLVPNGITPAVTIADPRAHVLGAVIPAAPVRFHAVPLLVLTAMFVPGTLPNDTVLGVVEPIAAVHGPATSSPVHVLLIPDLHGNLIVLASSDSADPTPFGTRPPAPFVLAAHPVALASDLSGEPGADNIAYRLLIAHRPFAEALAPVFVAPAVLIHVAVAVAHRILVVVATGPGSLSLVGNPSAGSLGLHVGGEQSSRATLPVIPIIPYPMGMGTSGSTPAMVIPSGLLVGSPAHDYSPLYPAVTSGLFSVLICDNAGAADPMQVDDVDYPMCDDSTDDAVDSCDDDMDVDDAF